MIRKRKEGLFLTHDKCTVASIEKMIKAYYKDIEIRYYIESEYITIGAYGLKKRYNSLPELTKLPGMSSKSGEDFLEISYILPYEEDKKRDVMKRLYFFLIQSITGNNPEYSFEELFSDI